MKSTASARGSNWWSGDHVLRATSPVATMFETAVVKYISFGV